jgi:glutamate carboxypeptidase
VTRVVLALLLLVARAAAAQPADPTEQAIVAAVDAGMPRTLALLERTVKVKSATTNLAGVRKVARLYERELRALGFRTRWVKLPRALNRAGHLFAERAGTRGKRLLLIGHLDTVLENEPWRREGEVAYGSGAVDMKGGNAIVVGALRALHTAGALDGVQVIVAFTGDEEAPGRPTEISRRELVDAARRSDAALAFEVVVADTATVARRGTALWKLEVDAVTGHSSAIGSNRLGHGAILAAADILARFHAELRERYLTFNPSHIEGGSDKSNVVAARVVVEGDLRFISEEQRERIKERMRAIAAVTLPGARAAMTFVDSYPPMAPSAANEALLAVLDRVSRDLGDGPVQALDPGQRGAGDVSFVAAHVPGLDGLGASGGNSHAAGEYLELDTLPRQTRRAALLIYRLTR